MHSPTLLTQNSLGVVLCAAMLTCIGSLERTLTAADPPNAPRAARPQWPQEVIDAFFVDAREHLVGPRPQRRQTEPSATGGLKANANGSQDLSTTWSQLVDGDTLETEVKRIAFQLQAELKSSGVFHGGGFQQCRRDFSMLAVLFAVIHQFDQDVRWQRDAAAWSHQFARCGFQCKEATDETFAEAKTQHDLLVDLLRGNRHRLEMPEAPTGYDQIADLTVLMQCMKESLREQISPHLGNNNLFRQHATDLEHQAQLLAMLAEWVGHEGYDYWDDESYAHQARQLRAAAIDMATASRQHEYGQARQAAGRIGKACSNCHEDYRG